MDSKAVTANELPYVLAIDVGSSAVRAGLYDARASLVPGSAVNLTHGQVVETDGTSVEDADELAQLVDAAVDQVLAQVDDLGSAAQITGAGLASMASTVLGVDSAFQPVTPVFTYADSRTGNDVEQLRSEIDTGRMYQRTGVMQHWSYVPARIMWLQRTQPEVYRRIDKWVDFPTFLYCRWFGKDAVRTSHSLAAWSGMQNRQELDWDTELLDSIGLSTDRLPSISSVDDVQTGLTGDYARRWDSLRETRFALGVGDGAAVNIGTGCVGPDRVAITVGTTAAMRLLAEHPSGTPLPHVPRGLWGYPLEQGRTLMGGAFTEGGSVVKWCSDVMRIPDISELGAALAEREPAAHGLTVLPFLSGERATGWATDATAAIQGLTAATDGIDIVQAMMEAVAYRFSLVAELLEPYATSDRIFVAGGNAMTGSDWWVQTISDVLGAEICTTTDDEATMRGAAVLALRAIGEWETLSDHVPQIAKRFEPRHAHYDRHRVGIERQRELYGKLV